ncbi:hypothetical protein BDBG_16034, partial [Blastomyces gilchristii SLH14081]
YIIMNDISSSSSHMLLTVFLHNADMFIFIHVKSSCIDRSVSADNSELNVESLIENLKNTIMKKLSVLCVAESLMSLSALSVSFSATFPSQSPTPAPVSDSPTSAISVPVSGSPASATPALSSSITSAFIISSPHFKKMLYRLDELHFSAYILLFFLLISRTIYYICVFRNRNTDVILFYICEHET